MKIKLPPGIIVKIATIGTVVWLVLSLGEIPGYDTSPQGKIDLFAIAIIGAVVISGMGIVLQEVYDFYLAKKRGRRHDD